MTIEASKTVVRELVREVWNEGRAAAIHRYFAPDLSEEVGRHHAELHAAFSELRVAIEALIAERDMVAARLVVSGTHDKGPFAGASPSGKRLTWVSHRFYRLVDERVAETWAMQDRLGLMQQLGLATMAGSGVHWADGAAE